MTTNAPPRVASWLLRAFYTGPSVDAVVGDLAERYATKQSSRWYWRQAVSTVAVSILADVWSHKLLAVRAVFCGVVAASVLRYVLFGVAASPMGNVIETLSGESRHVFLGRWGAVFFLGGAGWVVSRLHRGHAATMVLVFAAVLLLANSPELERRAANALIDARYVPALRELLLAQSLWVISILFGGVASADWREKHR
jgi:hypothetical protein